MFVLYQPGPIPPMVTELHRGSGLGHEGSEMAHEFQHLVDEFTENDKRRNVLWKESYDWSD